MAEPTIRYIAGISAGNGPTEYSVLAVSEKDGERVNTPVFVIGAMTREQAEHLHLQLTNVLGIGI